MLTVEHEAAEALRHMRLKAYAPHRPGNHVFRWLFDLLGWRAARASHATFQARID